MVKRALVRFVNAHEAVRVNGRRLLRIAEARGLETGGQEHSIAFEGVVLRSQPDIGFECPGLRLPAEFRQVARDIDVVVFPRQHAVDAVGAAVLPRRRPSLEVEVVVIELEAQGVGRRLQGGVSRLRQAGIVDAVIGRLKVVRARRGGVRARVEHFVVAEVIAVGMQVQGTFVDGGNEPGPDRVVGTRQGKRTVDASRDVELFGIRDDTDGARVGIDPVGLAAGAADHFDAFDDLDGHIEVARETVIKQVVGDHVVDQQLHLAESKGVRAPENRRFEVHQIGGDIDARDQFQRLFEVGDAELFELLAFEGRNDVRLVGFVGFRHRRDFRNVVKVAGDLVRERREFGAVKGRIGLRMFVRREKGRRGEQEGDRNGPEWGHQMSPECSSPGLAAARSRVCMIHG